MRVKDINRVVIRVKDLDKGIEFYSKLLNTTFDKLAPELTGSFGVRAAISWEAKVELVSPLPSRDSVDSELSEEKEGLFAVIFNMDDVEAARKTAEEMGVGVKRTIEMSQDQITAYFQDRFKKFKEYNLNLNATGGVDIYLGQIELKEE